MPLMNAMKFRDVHEWHSAVQELGKDIVAWKEDEFGSRINTAVVAKAGRISGSVVHEVSRQIFMSINNPFQDPITHEEMEVHTVWVVTSKEIPTDSMPGIWAQIPVERHRQVRFIDGEKLWESWQEHFPIATHQSIQEAYERIKQIDTPYRVEVTLSPEGQRLTIGESYPGQLEVEPLEIKGKFEIPNTPEGLRLIEDINAMFTRGEAADIPPGILNIEFPEPMRHIYQQVYGEVPDGQFGFRMSSIPGALTVAIRIDIEGEDGTQVEFPFIELRSIETGSEQITLTNDHQKYPIRVTQVVSFNDRSVNIKFDRKSEPIAAPILLQLLLALKALTGECKVRITNAETDVMISERSKLTADHTSFDDNYFDFVSLMVLVQKKTGVPIFIPNREFSEEELEVIGRLWWISKTPRLVEAWDLPDIPLYGKSGDEESLLGQYENIESQILRLEEDCKIVSLFGSDIPIGRVRTRYPNPRIINAEEVRRALAGTEEDIVVYLRMIPTQTPKMYVEYLDWEDPDQPIRMPEIPPSPE